MAYLKKNKSEHEIYRKILEEGKVFARMKPEEKAMVVDELKRGQEFIVGMCGDGANDCPALKVANVGVSLSEADASIAAPFLSKITDISCIDILIREGRAALVTSAHMFKFMALYAMIQGVAAVCLYRSRTVFTNYAYMYQDIILVLPLVITMSYTKPYDKLTVQSPSARLISSEILCSVLGQIGLVTAWQVNFVVI